jgi:hypothetical protein
MVPVVLALCLWGNQFQFKKDLLRIDNNALVTVINKQTSESNRLMQLVREFVLLVMEFGIIVRSLHITTHSNSVADYSGDVSGSWSQMHAGSQTRYQQISVYDIQSESERLLNVAFADKRQMLTLMDLAVSSHLGIFTVYP